jgi:hypothetical protein
MVTRAVYVDVAISLSAKDFLMVMRRFLSVYRKPAHMFSDNGTNLTRAEPTGTSERRQRVGDGIKGAWSPVVLSAGTDPSFWRIARVTSAIGEEHVIRRAGPRESCVTSDEVLRTLLFEVAGLLNSRPLTYTSSDPDDFRPLTPNDFLNRAPGG